jgi:hypothetical protein
MSYVVWLTSNKFHICSLHSVLQSYHHHHHQWLYSPCGPWPPHTGGFIIYFRHLVGLLWTSDQPVAKASTYTGQHNIRTQRQTSMPPAGFEPTIPATKWPRLMPLGSATLSYKVTPFNPCKSFIYAISILCLSLVSRV